MSNTLLNRFDAHPKQRSSSSGPARWRAGSLDLPGIRPGQARPWLSRQDVAMDNHPKYIQIMEYKRNGRKIITHPFLLLAIPDDFTTGRFCEGPPVCHWPIFEFPNVFWLWNAAAYAVSCPKNPLRNANISTGCHFYVQKDARFGDFGVALCWSSLTGPWPWKYLGMGWLLIFSTCYFGSFPHSLRLAPVSEEWWIIERCLSMTGTFWWESCRSRPHVRPRYSLSKPCHLRGDIFWHVEPRDSKTSGLAAALKRLCPLEMAYTSVPYRNGW